MAQTLQEITDPANPGFWGNTVEGQRVLAGLLGLAVGRTGAIQNPVFGYSMSPFNPNKGAPLRDILFWTLEGGSAPASLLETGVYGLKRPSSYAGETF